MKKHQPVHVYLDEEIYFLSVHVYDDFLVIDDQKKKDVLDKFKSEFDLFNYKWYAYTVLNNHYHLLFKTFIGKDLSDILKKVHGGLSYKWNKDEN